VALGRIPQPVRAPFVHIEPALTGSFRWSGTTTLIFTPDKGALRYATRYRVTVDAGRRPPPAGRPWARRSCSSSRRPTVRLLQADWYRRGGRYDRPVVLLLRFNQPVSAATLLPHLAFRTPPHPWTAPARPAATGPGRPHGARRSRPRWRRPSAAAANAAHRRARRGRTGTRRRFPPSADLLVLETVERPRAGFLDPRRRRGRSAERAGTGDAGGGGRQDDHARAHAVRRTASGARRRATPRPTTRCASAAVCPFRRCGGRCAPPTSPIPRSRRRSRPSKTGRPRRRRR
jgi:hypothetical protein